MHDIRFIVVDLFCGAGGVTSGIEDAGDHLGRKIAKVVACVNHDPLAIESHEANHPGALHLSEDIRRANIRPILNRLEKEKRLHPDALVLLWASAECTNYSIAKGGMPRDADSRTLPNAVIRYIKAIRPDYVYVENVREFLCWGELDENGKPISRDKGRDYIRWCNRIQRLGYDYHYRLLNVADYGGHTRRIRYFGVFARPELPIRFPAPSHAQKPQQGMFGTLQKWRPVREVLDLEEEGRSIFDRPKPLVDRTLKRILAGLEKFVAAGDRQWLVKYNNNGEEVNRGASIESPSATITTRPSLALAHVDFLDKYYRTGTAVSVEQPAPTLTTKDRLSKVKVQFLDKRYGSGDHNHQGIEDPASTLTTNPKLALVSEGFIAPTNYDAAPHDLEQPLGSITANRKWHYLINPQWGVQVHDLDKPCFTLIARMDKMPPILICTEAGELAIRIDENDSETMRKIKFFMAHFGIVDIKMRMLSIPELKRITGFPEDYYLAGTLADQKKFIGNAVPPLMAQRLIEAAVGEALEARA